MAVRIRLAGRVETRSNRIERGAMNVYVESNFVLEAALDQEQSESCADLIALASAAAFIW
jgi:hypothetical protein